MLGHLKRRLERLLERHPSAAGRAIVLEIEADRVDDKELVGATLAGAGVEPGENDILVLVRRLTAPPAPNEEPPCSLVSVSQMTPKTRHAPR